MKKTVMILSAVAALAAGTILAQGHRGAGGPGGLAMDHGRHMEMLATALNLTDAQKQQAKTIFEAAKEQGQALRPQMKASHDALAKAVKENQGDAQIDALARDEGALLGQMVATQSKAFAKFYQILTPEQREKADQLHGQFRGMMESRFGGHRQ